MTNNRPATDDTLEAKRDTIRQSLNAITAELNSALVRVGLGYPVYICVPSSGESIATFATALDPDDREWSLITDITREIVSKKIGSTRLTTRPLACAMAGTSMAATDVTVDSVVCA